MFIIGLKDSQRNLFETVFAFHDGQNTLHTCCTAFFTHSVQHYLAVIPTICVLDFLIHNQLNI